MGKIDHNSYSVPTKITRQISEKHNKSDNAITNIKNKEKQGKKNKVDDDMES